jgi:septal ring factor EnvC (AmiA/AmiB activator)
MEAIIRERDETIAAQARLMKGWRRLALRPSDLQSDIAAQARLIEERWAAMQRMEAIIRERDETIAAQARMVEERWAAMQRMGQEIANRDQSIAGLQQELQNAKQKLFLPHAGSPHEGP